MARGTGAGQVMKFAIVGCGYVADFYLDTLKNHPELELTGAFDRDPDRLRQFTQHHGLRAYSSLDALLSDSSVKLVANLTNPASHYSVIRAALEAGKHVYSEKPLATDLAQVHELVQRAEAAGLLLASAPCSVLGETAQTLWRALRDGRIGQPRLVYAELDDGNVARAGYENWTSSSGAKWPAKDEFEVGCTLEHAGYYLTWLTTFFGPVKRMSSFARVLQTDKGTKVDVQTADFAIGCFEFRSGVIARLTCSIFAPHDHRLRIFGDEGTLAIDRSWDYGAPVSLNRRNRLTHRLEKRPVLMHLLGPLGYGPRRVPLVRTPPFKVSARGSNRMDFCRGIAELAAAVRENRSPRLSARWSAHVNELVLAMQNPEALGSPREIESTFEPAQPMPWAQD
jgi:predicted dehydrogenase